MSNVIPSYQEWKDAKMQYGGGYTQWLADYKAGKINWKGEKYSTTAAPPASPAPVKTIPAPTKTETPPPAPYKSTISGSADHIQKATDAAGQMSFAKWSDDYGGTYADWQNARSEATQEQRDQKALDAATMGKEAWEKKYKQYGAYFDQWAPKGNELLKASGITPPRDNSEPFKLPEGTTIANGKIVTGSVTKPTDPTNATPKPATDAGQTGDTIAQQNAGNSTGMNYLDWKKEQLKVNPSAPVSYNDWLAAMQNANPDKGKTSPDTTSGGASTATDPNKYLNDALTFINNSGLDEPTKALFRQVVQGWDATKEVNMQNVLNSFNDIRQKTIDPYFREQATVLAKDVKQQMDQLSVQREQELETERTLAGQTIRQAKEGLEKAGMTFSGKGIEQLGEGSAYAQAQSITRETPGQIPFGGLFHEGTVNQANRLMASGSQLRYQDRVNTLGRQAENIFGTGVAGLNLPGYTPVGLTTGSLDEQKNVAYANQLSGLAGQQSQNNAYKESIKLFQ